MQILVLNESSKKALVRSRRVLSKFLPQLGSSTWAGALSEEGLEDLRTALRAAGVSKNTAISCLQVEGRGRLTPRWTLGSRAPFDDSGRFAFRQTEARAVAQPPVARSPRERLNLALLRLAGLAHDTGKASQAFADKLRRGHGAEALRHELVSFLVLAESLRTAQVTDVQWLSRIRENPRAMVGCVEGSTLLPADSLALQCVKEALASARRAHEQRQANRTEGEPEGALDVRQMLLSGSDIQGLMQTAPALSTLLWLVLTHHRLPDSDQTAQAWWAGQHLHLPSEALNIFVADLDACLQVARGTPPWQDDAWLKSVSSAAESALQALAELNFSLSENLPSTAAVPELSEAATTALLSAHYLRPALILADHLGSQRAKFSFYKSDKQAKEHIFANTLSEKEYGDTLARHELEVARLTRKVVHLYETRWPATELPRTSLSVVRPLPAPFDWQMHLEDACQEARAQGPVFVSIIAETGAGKTLGGLRAVNALNQGRLRVTLALGQRSLTQQSADAMLNDAGLNAKDLVVAVGSPQTLGLADKFKALKEEESSRFGSESAEGAEAGLTLSTKTAPDLTWLEGFCTEKEAPELWGSKSLAMLAAPVLACTADHLVSSATLLRGGDAKMYLRLASCDLWLDEIDAYSANDLQSIGKLVFTSGLHGRNIVLMSATLTPEVRNGLYGAWIRGLTARAHLKGIPSAHACVFSSNTLGSEVVLSAQTALEPQTWQAYASRVAAAYQKASEESPRRRAKLIPLDLNGTKTDAFEALAQAACSLHRPHHTVDPETGVRVSVGFVRLNTAKNAWTLARHLSERDSRDIDVRFVSYHSKYPRTYLGVLDATLGELTNRKHPHRFLQTQALRRALQETTKKDLVVVVCTTTLIETGRDFDFDWCVLEPRSVRGEIQAIGRVWRHRRSLTAREPNVALLSHPLKVLEPPEDRSKESVWGRPGVEDELVGLRVTTALPAVFAKLDVRASAPSTAAPQKVIPRGRLGRNRQQAASAEAGDSSTASYVRGAQDALPVRDWEQAMDASPCLQPRPDYPQDRIGYLERRTQALHLSEEGPWDRASPYPPSLALYLGTLASLNREHASRTKFRGARETQLIFVPQADGIRYVDEQAAKSGKPAPRRPALGASRVETSALRALLPDIQSDAQKLFTGTDPNIDGCALRCAGHLGAEKKLSWHPLLGFREGA